MPTFLQASISRVPAGAVTFLPSTVSETSGIENQLSAFALASGQGQTSVRQYRQLLNATRFFKRTRPSFQMVFKFLAEFLHKSNDRHRSRIAQRAESPAKHVLGKILNVIDI